MVARCFTENVVASSDRRRSGLGQRLALVVGSLAAAGLGWFLARQFGSDEQSGTALAAVALYRCPTAGGSPVGQVHAGDKVWLIGTTDHRWAVIRDPERPDQPAWMPLAQVATNASARDLPELTCAAAIATGGATTSDLDGGPTPTVDITTTVVSAATTSDSSTSTSTSTTIAADLIAPTVTITAERTYLYVLTGVAPCSAESELEVTIVVADATVPLTIRSIVANWTTGAGPQTANLSPVGGNRFRLQVPANGPTGGSNETPLTLTGTGADGVGNVGSGQLVVSLRNPGGFGCAG